MGEMTRKEFLRTLVLGSSALLAGGAEWGFTGEEKADNIRGEVFKKGGPTSLWAWAVEGYDYDSLGNRNVQCRICPHRCVLEPGDRSICRSKVNIEGRLYSLTYGNPCSLHVDPIEKKPLFHFLPRSRILSLATTGCNFRCLNCQNWEISQKRPEEVRSTTLFPDEVVAEAVRLGIPSIAYTYSEPVTFYEYMLDTATAAREGGLKNVMVSNGYINREPLRRLCRVLDAANINLKSFDDKVYRSLNGGTLAPVLETFKTLHGEGVWFEMTTLVVPTYVDDLEMTQRMCGWILRELGSSYPLHLLRFFPHYRLTRLPATPVATLEAMRETAKKEGIAHVYVGNVPGHEGCHTTCPGCGARVVVRNGYLLTAFHIEKGRCAFCGAAIPGRWG